MADRSVVVRFRADASNFLTGVKSMRSETQAFSQDSTKGTAAASDGYQKIGNVALVAGAALAAGLGLAVKKSAEFEKSISAVAAATGEGAAGMSKLRQAAIDAGASTQYSATEAANAITELSKAGIQTADILNGGLSGALTLAAAGQIEVARAAEIAAISINQFGLEGKDVTHIADLFAAGAAAASGSVEDIAQAMKFAGTTADSYGVSIEDTTAVISLFASKGIIGEQAGTSFRSMLLGLTAPSKAAAKTIEELGIDVFDGSGKFIGLEKSAQVLQDRLGPLDQETRNAALAQIFGNQAIGAAQILYEGGAEAVATWRDEVNQAGFAQAQAAALTDNLAGDVERLGGAFDTALIQSGSGANDALRGLVQTVTSAIDVFNALPPVVQGLGVGLVAVSAASLLAVGGTIKLVGAVGEARTAILAVRGSSAIANTALLRLGSGMATTAKLAGGLAVGLAAVGAASAIGGGGAIDSIGYDKLANSLRGAADPLDTINQLFGEQNELGGFAAGSVADLGEALQKTFDPSVTQKADNAAAALQAAFGGTNNSSIKIAEQRLTDLDGALSKLVSSGDGDRARDLFDQISGAAREQGISMTDLREKFPQYGDAILKAGEAAKAAKAPVTDLDQAIADGANAADTAAAATSDYAKELAGINSPALDAREATRQFEAAIDDSTDALREYKNGLIKEQEESGKSKDAAKAYAAQQIKSGKALDIGTAAGRKNQAGLDAIAEAAISQISALQANGASQKTLQGRLGQTRERLVTAARQFGLTKGQAKAYADKVLQIPTARTTNITANVGGATRNIATVRTLIDQLRDKTITVRVQTGRINLPASAGGPTNPGLFRAKGGPVAAGNPYIVGEEGPELIFPSRPGYVLDASRSASLTAAAIGATRSTSIGPGSGSAGNVDRSVRVSVSAEPGLAREYAGYVAKRTATALQDSLAMHGLNR